MNISITDSGAAYAQTPLPTKTHKKETPKVADIRRYAQEMRQAIPDKLSLILDPRAEGESYLDFGCADGSVLSALKKARPEKAMLGYDIEKDMISLAREEHPDIKVTDDWQEVLLWASQAPQPRAIILSSVIHEVLSLQDDHKKEEFWNLISMFDVAIIRDMAHSEDAGRPPPTELFAAVIRKTPEALLRAFENRYGFPDTRRQLAHLMLKGRYPKDWEREIEEDYLALSIEVLKKRMKQCDMHAALLSHSSLPFLDNEAKAAYGEGYPCATHVKAIFKKKSPKREKEKKEQNQPSGL